MLGYRSTFAIDMDHTTTTDRDHVVSNVLSEGLTWLRKTKNERGIDSVEPATPTTLESGMEVVYLHDTQASGSEYARLVAMDPPQGDGLRWVTSLLVGIDHSKERRGPESWPWVAVEIDAPTDPNNSSRPAWTSRPRLVQSILGAYSCDDHGFLMGDGPRTIGVDQVDELLTQLRETDHHGLVILCGEDGTVRPDIWSDRLARITRETLGQASVFILSEDALHAFNDSVSPSHALTPYSPRTFRPGAVLEDPHDAYRHRVLSMKTLLRMPLNDLTRSFGRASREHANQQPLDRFLRRLDEISSIRLDEVTRAHSSGAHSSTTTPAPHRDRPFPPPASGPSRRRPVPPDTDTDDAAARTMPFGIPMVAGRPRASVSPTPTGIEAVPPSQAPAPREDLPRSEQTPAAVHQLEAQTKDLAAIRKELDAARSELERIRRDAEMRAVHAREESERLQESLRAQLEDEQLERALLDDDMRTTRSDVRRLQCQLDSARRLMAENGISDTTSWLEPEQDPYDEPVDSWEDLQTFAEMGVFDCLRFVGDWEDARDLADHDPTGQWVHTTWDSLAMLNDYARCRTSADSPFEGGLREFIGGSAPAGSHLIPAGRVRFNESETVRNNKVWMRERTCRVTPDVDPSEELSMVSHIVIQTRGSICPRLYFEDRTAELGQVLIGRIGSHPTNTKTT